MNLKNPLSWLSNGFGSGLSPVAPGTVGSFLALLIYYFMARFALVPFLRWLEVVAARKVGR